MKHEKPKLTSWSNTSIAGLPVCSKTWQQRDPLKTKGLYLVQQANKNCRSFHLKLQFRGDSISQKLGDWPAMNHEEARDEARKWLKKLKQEEKEDASPRLWTVAEAQERFIADMEPSERSAIVYRHALSQLGWDDRELGSITSGQVVSKAHELVRGMKDDPRRTLTGVKYKLDRLKMLISFANARIEGMANKIDVSMIDRAKQEAKAVKAKPRGTPQYRSGDDWVAAYKIADDWWQKRHSVAALHWMIAAQTAMRPWREPDELMWDEFDFNRGCLVINRERMKVRGAEAGEAELPDVFTKYLNPTALKLLKDWYNDPYREKFHGLRQWHYVFPRRSQSTVPHVNGCHDNIALANFIREVLGYRVTVYSNKSFWITKAKHCGLDSQVRLGLTDHTRSHLDTHEAIYYNEDSQDWHDALRTGENIVGNRLAALLAPATDPAPTPTLRIVKSDAA